ncbi:MAG TPA: sugar ABC transporter permease [Thermoanaerobaculia bacterium]|nr:sugar ABC transporter permease [Thermoanaerobaculia bacterium]
MSGDRKGSAHRDRKPGERSHAPVHAFLILFTIVSVYPVLWVFTVAFSGKQSLAIVNLPPEPRAADRLRAITPWPDEPSPKNFVSVMREQPFGRWVFNSAVVSAATTLVGVVMACTAAYAFSRFKFPGRRTGLMMFLVSQMFPGVLTMIPLYIILVQWLELGSSWIALILMYATTAIPFCVWMLKGYFDTIPKELEESALMDGASTARIFFSIVLPLAKPAVAVTALFSFMTAWNEFILAATFMDKETMYTAPIGLRFFVGGFSQQWGYFAAGAIIVAIPVVVLFLFLQKYLVSGLTAGAVKG